MLNSKSRQAGDADLGLILLAAAPDGMGFCSPLGDLPGQGREIRGDPVSDEVRLVVALQPAVGVHPPRRGPGMPWSQSAPRCTRPDLLGPSAL